MRSTVQFLLFISVLVSSQTAFAGISQGFDSEGNPLAAGRGTLRPRTAEPSSRFSVPDGVRLLNDVRYEYYPVFGRTFAEIVRSVAENSPFDRKARRNLPTKLEWKVSWTYDYDYEYETDEEKSALHEDDALHQDGLLHVVIEILDVKPDFDITVTLPTLLDDSALNPAEKDLWKAYFMMLLEHEHDHVKILRDETSLNLLKKDFADINYVTFEAAGVGNVEGAVIAFLREETARKGREWIAHLRDRIADYDKITDYGARHNMRGIFFGNKTN